MTLREILYEHSEIVFNGNLRVFLEILEHEERKLMEKICNCGKNDYDSVQGKLIEIRTLKRDMLEAEKAVRRTLNEQEKLA